MMQASEKYELVKGTMDFRIRLVRFLVIEAKVDFISVRSKQAKAVCAVGRQMLSLSARKNQLCSQLHPQAAGSENNSDTES
jgi:hypothetical protein